MSVTVFVEGGVNIHPDVIAAHGQYKNMSSIVQYLNTTVLTLPVKVSSLSRHEMRNTFGVKNQAKIPCPSVSYETRNKNDSYEVQYDAEDKKNIVCFKRSPLYYQERCANESQPCCSQAAAKCKTHDELKIFVRLIVVNDHISLVNSKDNIRIVAVGKYCKCNIWNDIESILNYNLVLFITAIDIALN